MSRGRHSRPQARGGGLAALLALAFAGAAVAVALTQPSGRNVRFAVVGLAAVSALALLILARTQRSSSRALARIEDRLHTLEQRNRDEGEQLHRRVLEGITREGELFGALQVLAAEISHLRAALEGFALSAVDESSAAGQRSAQTAADLIASMANPTLIDVPLVQRVFAVQEDAEMASWPPPATQPQTAPGSGRLTAVGTMAAPTPYAPAPTSVPAAYAPAVATVPAAASPPGVAPSVPGVLPTPAAAPVAAPAAAAASTPEAWGAPSVANPDVLQPAEPLVSSWVVRELQLEEPTEQSLPRVLDLTRPATTPSGDAAQLEADAASAQEQAAQREWTKSSFARPA
jgi:hypothetical protein